MNIAIISMGNINNKFSRIEHCCFGLSQKPSFPVEAVLFYFTLKKNKKKARFFDGNLINEEKILKELKKNPPKKIIYYVYTPFIRYKKEFMENLSKFSKLYVVAVPFFWKEKILREFPFVEDVWYDGEKGMKLDSSNTQINYQELDLEPYLNGSFPVLFSKYCPYQCTFCNARCTGLMERKIDIVEEEIDYLKKKGVRKINICGNNLTINKNKFLKICKIMQKEGLEWTGDGRINHMDKDMYEPLRKSKGVLLFGIESANQKILDKIKKGIKIKDVIKVADNLKKRKIPFRYEFMFGFPWDSKKTFKETVKLKKKVGSLNYHCSILNAFPGTPVFEYMKKYNLIDEEKLGFEDFSWQNLPIAPTLYLSRKQIKKFLKKIMIRGALNKSVVKNIIKTKRINEYPGIFVKAINLLIHGKRSWKK